jgi:hypothetical protein
LVCLWVIRLKSRGAQRLRISKTIGLAAAYRGSEKNGEVDRSG